MKKRMAVLTAGGDCPGINAVIRAVTKTAVNDYDMEVIGIEDGYLGLIEARWGVLAYERVSGILTQGGTILGTSNKANPFKYPVDTGGGGIGFKDVSDQSIANFEKTGASVLVAIGGDGTLNISHLLGQKGVPVVGIPKTIDNDVDCTDLTFGFDSAVSTAAEAIDKIHTTAQSHHRVMFIEVMGRYVGWLALHAGVAGGGDIILIPEIPYDSDVICEEVVSRSKRGKKFSIVVVSEGAKPCGGDVVVRKVVRESTDPVRLGGVGNVLADEVESKTGLETRVTVLGHLQRGGSPTAFDRVLATRFGTEAARHAFEGNFGSMVALRGQDIVSVPISDAIGKLKSVPVDSGLMRSARSVGTCFGAKVI
jgi:phosphofructokinase-like protein